MRKLKTSDIMAFCRTVKKIGIKDEIKRISAESDDAKSAWDKGFELIYNIFDLATEKKSEKHLYEFLAEPFEMTAKEVEDMDLEKFIESVKEFASENNLTSFFKSAATLMK